MTFERTPEGKMVLYRTRDGQRFERWPIDGRSMLATGEYTADPLNGDVSQTATVAPGSEAAPEVPALPTEHSPGVPLVAMKAADAPPAKPVAIPGATPRGRR